MTLIFTKYEKSSNFDLMIEAVDKLFPNTKNSQIVKGWLGFHKIAINNSRIYIVLYTDAKELHASARSSYYGIIERARQYDEYIIIKGHEIIERRP